MLYKIFFWIGILMFAWGLIDLIRAGISPVVPWICTLIWFGAGALLYQIEERKDG